VPLLDVGEVDVVDVDSGRLNRCHHCPISLM
jgi:hypothetical protein